MSTVLTVPPRAPFQTFLGFPLQTDLDVLDADVAILGLPYGAPYSIAEVTNDQSNAPTAVRQASARLSQHISRYDFDLGGPILAGKPIRVVDVGDVAGDAWNLGTHYRTAEEVARVLFGKVKMLCTIGGDHGVPIPIFRAMEVLDRPITMVHVDAHLDWREEVNGVREGYSNTFRRASEMPWITSMYQIGLRGQGSAQPSDVADAKAWGSNIFTAYDVYERGIGHVLDAIPDGGTYYLSIDADGVDPSIMPAVMAPSPGGLLQHHMRALIHGLVGKGRLVGIDVVEIAPKYDHNDLTSITAGRLFVNAIGAAAHAGHLD